MVVGILFDLILSSEMYWLILEKNLLSLAMFTFKFEWVLLQNCIVLLISSIYIYIDIRVILVGQITKILSILWHIDIIRWQLGIFVSKWKVNINLP